MQKVQYIKIDERGNKYYYSDKEMTILHREDGPACEWTGGKSWWHNGKRHREDGPAIESTNGEKASWLKGPWWLNGFSYTEEEFHQKLVKTIYINGIEVSIETVNNLIANAKSKKSS